jgi:hypothetical protein
VELGYTEHISHETVRKVLKKNELKPWLKQCWCIPPEASVAFVWRMEDVLEVYTRPYDPRFPQVCMHESAKQRLKDQRESLPVQPGQPERGNYTFEAAGMCKIFLAGEPLAGKRFVKADFAPHECGLGSLHSRMSGCALSPSREACVRDGQPQYPYAILLVFHLCSAASPSHPQKIGNPLHARTWELAEYGRD